MGNEQKDELSSVIQEKIIDPIQKKMKDISKMSDDTQSKLNSLQAENKRIKIILAIVAFIAVANIVLIFTLR